MAEATLRISTTKERLIRAAVTGAIAAATIIGGTAIASADTQVTTYTGPARAGEGEAAAVAAAQPDIPGLEAQCRADRGAVTKHDFFIGVPMTGNTFLASARVYCRGT